MNLKSNNTKSWFFEKKNKTDINTSQGDQEAKLKTQVNIWNDEILTDTLQRVTEIIRSYVSNFMPKYSTTSTKWTNS